MGLKFYETTARSAMLRMLCNVELSHRTKEAAAVRHAEIDDAWHSDYRG